jgi:MerR family copper efflux transcriptional regulator
MVRYYESIDLISAASTTGFGYQQYSNLDAAMLWFAKRSRDLAFSIMLLNTLLSVWQNRSRRSAEVKPLAQDISLS